MAAFVVLLSDATEHAADQGQAQYPGARLAVVAAEVIEGQDQRQLLADWLPAKGYSAPESSDA